LPQALLSGAKAFSINTFNLVFPDECRICEQPLNNLSRIPVCPPCLSLPEPLHAEFFCRACRTPFVDSYPLDEHDLCTICRESQVNFDAAYSFGSYDGPLRQLIHLFKYAKVESLAAPLSRFLFQAMPLEQHFDLAIAMPMHWRKRWERGFNQAELLAKPLAKRCGLKMSTALRRKRYTKAQAGLTETQRRENLKGSFSVRSTEQIAGKRILLVDDVFTTGATLRSAAGALKDAGASHVTALTLARVDRRNFHQNANVSSGQSALEALSAATEFASPKHGNLIYAEPGSTS
jgi:ComF family protein